MGKQDLTLGWRTDKFKNHAMYSCLGLALVGLSGIGIIATVIALAFALVNWLVT